MHVIDWHPNFDALIGTEDFVKLGANINYKENTLKIKDAIIPFLFEYTSNQVKPQTIYAHNSVTIPVTIENGEVIIPETPLTPDTIIPECLGIARNGYCTIPLQHHARTELNFSERLKVTPLTNEQIIQPCDLTSQKQQTISHLIRTQHL